MTSGQDGTPSTVGTMRTSGQSREDVAELTPPSLNKSLRIGSWNVRTMLEVGKQEQIRLEMRRYRLHILGIGETHLSQCRQKQLDTGEVIIQSGEETTHRKGVALMISKKAYQSFEGWEAHGPRLLRASFRAKKKKINIIQAYAPTNDATEEEKDDFYNRLQGLVDKLSMKDVNIVMGDMNAKVGKDNRGFEHIMGKHGTGEANDNGERFLDFCALNNLVIGGTIFPHKRIHKTTWVSPDGRTENQIDHFCVARKFRRSLQDVRVMRGADVASDHHLVLAKVKLKLKRFEPVGDNGRRKFQVGLLQDPKKKESNV